MIRAVLLGLLSRSTQIVVGLLVLISGALVVLKIGLEPGSSIPYLQLLPKYAIFYPWVFATAIFAEISLLGFITSLSVLILSTKYVEKFWGYKEVLKFIFLVGTVTNFSTVIVVIIINVLRNDVLGMNLPLGGGISYYMGFLVVLKQVIPEHNVVLFKGLVNFRVKHFPFIALVSATLWSVIFKSFYPLLPSFFAFTVSYNYLRFFQSFYADSLLPTTNTATTGSRDLTIIRGDASDAFQFVKFFPEIMRPPLLIVIDRIYDISVLLSLIAPFDDDAIELSNLRLQSMSKQAEKMTQKGTSDADRRRQIALQVIEERANQQ
ncbi:hypothetical protein PUMCH_000447 [Australozyma saopauloensis]|uniref:DUF1751-domain-containing protein n=1 Tax=Australozyma saopauloensis TaxID=291208 RepID=A0AAX4H4G4_9ASCO|nr:hypothetical protein PUMCH_000447 [[Candida] saopauloensis]